MSISFPGMKRRWVGNNPLLIVESSDGENVWMDEDTAVAPSCVDDSVQGVGA